MCGRYHIETQEDIPEIRRLLQQAQKQMLEGAPAAQLKTGEIFPADTVPVITSAGARAMRWGFSSPGGKGMIINARAETAPQKRMFTHSLKHQRCAIPTNGFFEWRHEGGKSKEKYLFYSPNSPVLYLAAIYRTVGDDPLPRFAILTTAANESIAPYHDRMPVLLHPHECRAWIMDYSAACGILRRIPDPLCARQVKKAAPQQLSLF